MTHTDTPTAPTGETWASYVRRHVVGFNHRAKPMDYDELIESWINGNRRFVASHVAKMQRHEVLAFAWEFMRKVDDPQAEYGTLERLTQTEER